jgi:glyoxylase-like metal-dependent hydrolase (beta-lactamase superfamily II)
MRFVVLTAHNPGPYTGAGTNTYFLPGAVPTLIDAGAGELRHVEDVASAVAEAGVGRLAQVLVTHGHVDHAGGAPALLARWPGARFAKFPDAEYAARYPAPWTPVHDDELIEAGDTPLWAMHTPGHARDHLCFFEPRSGLLFAGDLVVNGGTVLIPASHGGSVAQYLDSLRRVLELRPRRILPGHGGVIEQPAALLRGYIAHRLARERQIVDLLTEQPQTVAAIVGRIYPNLAEGVRGAAAESVLAHLQKLRDEGQAVFEADAWRMVR